MALSANHCFSPLQCITAPNVISNANSSQQSVCLQLLHIEWGFLWYGSYSALNVCCQLVQPCVWVYIPPWWVEMRVVRERKDKCMRKRRHFWWTLISYRGAGAKVIRSITNPDFFRSIALSILLVDLSISFLHWKSLQVIAFSSNTFWDACISMPCHL